MAQQTTTKLSTVYFCTYRNNETSYQWRRSREYGNITDLLQAMSVYLTNNPNTQVTFQTRTFTAEQP